MDAAAAAAAGPRCPAAARSPSARRQRRDCNYLRDAPCGCCSIGRSVTTCCSPRHHDRAHPVHPSRTHHAAADAAVRNEAELARAAYRFAVARVTASPSAQLQLRQAVQAAVVGVRRLESTERSLLIR